jgi:hypothetical protein
MAAGRVLVVMVTALLLAGLVNADAMVERAQREPLGPGRDRKLAVWHPVQDLAHALQVHRLRALADAVVGDEDRGGDITGATDSAGTTGSPGTDAPATGAPITRPVRPEVRVPTPENPLRLWVGGDSMMRDLSESVERLAAGNALLQVTTHYEISSGLTRPDYFDWPAALEADMARTDSEIVILMLGANDGQGLVAADGTTYQRLSDAGWQAEYAARVGALMDQLAGGDRLVLWVMQPPMRDGDFDARMQIVNDLYRQEAADRPWIELVETAPLLGSAGGGFADQLPGPDGGRRDLRQDDGIHLAREGADALADHLLGLVAQELTPG